MLRNSLTLSLAFSALCACSASWGQVTSPFDKSSGGSGQGYPSRPVRVVVPFGTGAPDTLARVISQQLTVQMGQNFVVDNRPGANGIVGNETVARAAPDGHTLLIVSASFVVNPSIYRSLPYDARRDFAPVTNICALDAFILTVHPSVPARSVQELIALARKPGTKLSYASPGIGNTIHLAGALFNSRAGINLVHVPYKGGGPATIALLGGEVQAMFGNASLALAHIKAGKLRALGVTGRNRLSYLPDVPTLTEAGVSGMEIDAGWFGMFAPANTSAAILARLQGEVRKALAHPPVRERLVEQGFVPVGDTPAQFKAHVAAEFKAYAEMVQLAGIRPE